MDFTNEELIELDRGIVSRIETLLNMKRGYICTRVNIAFINNKIEELQKLSVKLKRLRTG